MFQARTTPAHRHLHHQSQSPLSNPQLTMGIVDAPNPTPARQRYFQEKYRQHVRLHHIGYRAKYLLPVYYVTLFGTGGAALYCMGRMVLGHKTWFGKG
ncbi:bacteriophage N adsorption protein A c-term domain-containing protein [Zalerion maritima]|uniref:Bacteriophage N adsorption protein A c-term domain-containing protein n=1 Tax=Zalerion maritima TaxID=339359 RepID=A0AAD5RII1_9PEZI|nr:bacteriophage N adsorption protein A c-term domain-containing protein [Zalerion maritima]